MKYKTSLTLILISFLQVSIYSACQQKKPIAKAASITKPVSTSLFKTKKDVSCCQSNIPPRFGSLKVKGKPLVDTTRTK